MFETHKLNDAGFEAVKKFKTGLSMAVSEALEMLPQGRERSIFVTKLEEAVFFGTKAIASDPKNNTEVVNYPEVSHSDKK